ncbi:competence protein CoiA family protein [Deinococcus sp. MIMF12]|uniref:Competence protein CoiA family protein n=1 Tax=Deinococcus rhizophilus TaxID=3049544 RepID=A0ABT7JM17_9DEIO|nr:competence protein CoiA family protein [Deinococcus rhizophilus]MDL2345530.1 competence protein CoiA family protein [Deinococcus rhizophilus]
MTLSPDHSTASRHQGVAYAANVAGEVVRPHTAPRGEPYTCLLCQEPVILRRGLVRVPHFAHRADSACSASGESIEHAAFKRLLASGLRKHCRFTAQVKCPGCGQDQTTTYPLSPGSEVREEITVKGFRADVGIVRGGEVVLAFEVYVTHEVGGEKALGLPVPWLEVAANPAGVQNLEKKPTVRVLDTNLFRHRPCRACGQSAGSRAEAEHLPSQTVCAPHQYTEAMGPLERITVDPRQCGGRPCIRGIRIRVSDILDLLGQGVPEGEILEDYPDLEREDIHAALLYAARYLNHPRLSA